MSPNAITPEQRKSNARLAWLLGSIAVLLFVAKLLADRERQGS